MCSRYARIILLKEKTASAIKNALQKLLTEVKEDGGKVDFISADMEAGLYSTIVQDYLKSKKVLTYKIGTLGHASIVESLIKTLKQNLWKVMEAAFRQKMRYKNVKEDDALFLRCFWIEKIFQTLDKYNKSKHSSLMSGAFSPKEVNDSAIVQGKLADSLWQKKRNELFAKKSVQKQREDSNLEPGTKVLISFDTAKVRNKNHTQSFSNVTYIIYKRITSRARIMFSLQDSQSKEILYGYFYREDIHPIPKRLIEPPTELELQTIRHKLQRIGVEVEIETLNGTTSRHSSRSRSNSPEY